MGIDKHGFTNGEEIKIDKSNAQDFAPIIGQPLADLIKEGGMPSETYTVTHVGNGTVSLFTREE